MPTDDLRALAEAVMPLNDEGLAHIKEQARSLHPDYPNGIHWHNRTVLALLDHLDKLEAALSEERIEAALPSLRLEIDYNWCVCGHHGSEHDLRNICLVCHDTFAGEGRGASRRRTAAAFRAALLAPDGVGEPER